MGLKRCM